MFTEPVLTLSSSEMDVLSKPLALRCRRFTFWHEGLTFLTYLQCKKTASFSDELNSFAWRGGGWGLMGVGVMEPGQMKCVDSWLLRLPGSGCSAETWTFLSVYVSLCWASFLAKQNELCCNQVALFARADMPTFLNVQPTPLFSGIQFCLPSNCSFDRTPQQTPGKPATWESFTDRQCETFCFNLSSPWIPPIKHLALMEPDCLKDAAPPLVFDFCSSDGRPLLFCIQTGGVGDF